MEDDIEVIQNPHLLSDLIADLDQLLGKNGWDILFTDTDTKNTEGVKIPCETHGWRPNYRPANWLRFAQRTDISPLFRQVGSRYGAYSMIIRRSGIKKLLSFFKCYQLFLPYDMDYTLPPGIRLFTVREDVVSTLPRALSDNGSVNHYVNFDSEG